MIPLPIRSKPDAETVEPMAMPRGMNTYRAPILPEPEAVQDLTAARAVLRALQLALRSALQGLEPESIALDSLPTADRELLAQVLGEGEVSAVACEPGENHAHLHVQEAIFAGVWRVLERSERGLSDRLEVGALPVALRESARRDFQCGGTGTVCDVLPDGVMNAPAILAELQAHWRTPAPATHVINLTLLPLSAADQRWLESALGRGSVTILSRGYGNCRITSSQRPNTWRVVYYNSEDSVILNTIEVCAVPEVACAAAQDLRDSDARLGEVLAWLEGA
jgi:hydrogenase-1 operon protein HyaF